MANERVFQPIQDSSVSPTDSRRTIVAHKAAIMDPSLLEAFIDRAMTDISENNLDSVIEVLNKMFKKSGLLCTAYLTAYLAKHGPSQLQLFLDRLEENPL